MKKNKRISVSVGGLISPTICRVCETQIEYKKRIALDFGEQGCCLCPECALALSCELQIAYMKAKRKENKKAKKEQV